MQESKYTLRYLPKYEEDLNGIVDYIIHKLKNATAANNLVDEVERAICKRLNNPESFEPYQSTKDRRHIYYRIKVKNFTIFYVVVEDVMEVRRLIYSRRGLTRLL